MQLINQFTDVILEGQPAAEEDGAEAEAARDAEHHPVPVSHFCQSQPPQKLVQDSPCGNDFRQVRVMVDFSKTFC
jgi:hypothetical protein